MATRKGKLAQKSKGRMSTTTSSPANFVSHDITADTANPVRLQFLFSRVGIAGSRAALVASLHWGAAA